MGVIIQLYRKISRIYPFIRRNIYVYWNRIHFSLNGAIYGARLRVFDRFYLTMRKGSTLVIGENFTFSSGDGINPISRNIRGKLFLDENAHILIGNNTGISSACILAKESVTIGNNVQIGADCIIMDTDAHSLNWRIRANLEVDQASGTPISDCKAALSKPIIIKDNALIGTRCIILKGVTIGENSIIGAGSIVSKSVPDNCIAAGNPCKIIRYLDL